MRVGHSIDERHSCSFVSAFVLGLLFLSSGAYCDETISVETRPNAVAIFLSPGTITLNFILPVTSLSIETDGGGPGGLGSTPDHGLQILVTASGQTLANYQINDPSVAVSGTVLNEGTLSFYNPVAQSVSISGSGTYARNFIDPEESVYQRFKQWTVENGPSVLVGDEFSSGAASAISPPNTTINRSAPVLSRLNIHAVVISGLSDPSKIISSPNVTITGGIVALGKSLSSLSGSASWSPGLRIVPDYALLTGGKIPPVTPNILDVRIVREAVTADFPSPSPQPGN